MNECHLSKALADFVSSRKALLSLDDGLMKQGGHYMRPDLIRLLVDTNRKDLVVREDKVNGGTAYTRTMDRVGLSVPLEEEE